ncbi:Potassium voltage-gated channel subfamily H member 5 [Liparis tanakae]|uniref:Potassium voltage-gated channel subfamily H member 5 n=1 Tax=Liparis tanakae TaxID=230148 RepID=A0A4Z2H0K7_9TELE|nr:Potassium voltage-gated channel subfamily H member 5 [Liparis tanakae]
MQEVGRKQIVFRKISEVKKEEEERQRAKNEVQLTIPQDHPVRKLFQKFKQQKELRHQGATGPPGASELEKNQLQVEQHHLQQHHQLHPSSLQLGHSSLQHSLPLSRQRPPPPPAMHNGAPPSSSVLTVSQVTPMRGGSLAYSPPGDPSPPPPPAAAAKPNNCAAVELQPGEQTVRVRISPGAVAARPAVKASGWMRLRNNTAPPDAGKEGLNNSVKAVSVEMLSQEGRGPMAENNPLRKTDSCDSGITKSELRIDRAGEARTPAAVTPLLHSPPLLPGGGGPRSPHLFCPSPDQALHAALHETRLELRDDIRTLGGRMGALETQVAEILKLLSDKKRPSLGGVAPPKMAAYTAAAPKSKTRRQDIFTVSRPVSPDSEKDDGL